MFCVVPKIGIFFVFVSIKVKRVLWIQREFDVAPVIVQSLLFDVLILLRYFFVPHINVIGSLLKSQCLNPAIDQEIIVPRAHSTLSESHHNRLSNRATTLVLESVVNR